jgi:hypothetical protein
MNRVGLLNGNEGRDALSKLTFIGSDAKGSKLENIFSKIGHKYRGVWICSEICIRLSKPLMVTTTVLVVTHTFATDMELGIPHG